LINYVINLNNTPNFL